MRASLTHDEELAGVIVPRARVGISSYQGRASRRMAEIYSRFPVDKKNKAAKYKYRAAI